jgi:hypothetical protein
MDNNNNVDQARDNYAFFHRLWREADNAYDKACQNNGDVRNAVKNLREAWDSLEVAREAEREAERQGGCHSTP